MEVAKERKQSKREGEEGFSGQVRIIFQAIIVTHTFESQ
jgi:hypothetical protein